MDYTNRNAQQNVAPSTAGAGSPVSPVSKQKGGQKENGKWGRIAIVAGVVAIVAILVGLAVVAGTSNTKDTQSTYVDSGKLQAVFLNTGQVYFGKIKTLNSKYIVLTNIYYLQTSGGSSASSTTTANSNTNVSLVKLGCELHEPYDQMVINGSQVTFWENLQDGGQVSKAVKSFQQQNPNGQKCSDQSSSASTTSGNNAQNAGTATKP